MEQENRNWTVLNFLVAGLIVAVIIQSVVIFGLHKKLNQPSGKPAENPQAVIKDDEPSAKMNQHAVKKPGSDNDDKDPFDWGSDDWDPFKEMQSMHDRINHMFGNAFNRFQFSDDFDKFPGKYAFSPDMNIEDKGDHYLVTVDIPGFEDSRLDVKLEGRTLSISGSIQSETKKEDKGKILRRERRSGNFHRSVTLPGPVKADKMTTSNKKGVLLITIPKETGAD